MRRIPVSDSSLLCARLISKGEMVEGLPDVLFLSAVRVDPRTL